MPFALPGQAILGAPGRRRVINAGSLGLLLNRLWLFIGDSTYVGVGAGSGGSGNVNGSRLLSTPLKAAARLASYGIPVASSSYVSDNNNGYTQAEWNGYRPDITVNGTLTNAASSPAIGGALSQITTATDGITFAPSDALNATAAWNASDTMDVWYARRTTAGTQGLSVDGGAIVSTDVKATTNDFVKRTLSLGSAAISHTVQWSRVAGTVLIPTITLAYNSAVPAVQILNAGSRNYTSTNWINTAQPHSPLTAIDVIQPYGVVISSGINEQRVSSNSIATMKTNIETIAARAVAAGAQVVIIQTPHPIGSELSWTNADMRQAYADLKTAHPTWILVDGPAVLGALTGQAVATYAQMNAQGYMNDTVHCTAPPYQALGYAIGDAMKTAMGF